MGTRTYSRRGANGTRVLTRLGRERQQSGGAAPAIALAPQRDRTAESQSFADAIRQRATDGRGKRRNVEVVEIAPSGNVVVTERKLTEAEMKKLDKLPSAKRPARINDDYEFPTRPTRDVVAGFMAYEGMTFEEALERVKADIAEYQQKQAESERIKKASESALKRIDAAVRTSEYVDRIRPLSTVLMSVAKELDRNPDLDVRNTLLQNFSMPNLQEFRNLSPAQLQRLVTVTYLLTNQLRENAPRVRARTLDLTSERSVYAAHHELLDKVKPDSFLPTFYDFVVEHLGA